MPEIPPASNGQPGLEFLVVCNESVVFNTVTEAIHAMRGRLNCASNIASAGDYIARRKIDGIVIDMTLQGTLELIDRVRRGNANKFSVIFACLGPTMEPQFALRAGANFVFSRSTEISQIERLFSAAASMMVAEKRRFFRYPLMVPVQLKVDNKDMEGTMANLSEGGMAIWCLQDTPRGATIQFSFELPFGGLIQGKGEIAWGSADGTVGIKFHILQDQAYTHLSGWLGRCDPERASSARIHPTALTGT